MQLTRRASSRSSRSSRRASPSSPHEPGVRRRRLRRERPRSDCDRSPPPRLRLHRRCSSPGDGTPSPAVRTFPARRADAAPRLAALRRPRRGRPCERASGARSGATASVRELAVSRLVYDGAAALAAVARRRLAGGAGDWAPRGHRLPAARRRRAAPSRRSPRHRRPAPPRRRCRATARSALPILDRARRARRPTSPGGPSGRATSCASGSCR